MKSIDTANCRLIEPLLAAYYENELSARQVLEVEKHLSDCSDCSVRSRRMHATVDLLQHAERFDASHDFMAKFHARLDNVELEAKSRRSIGEALRELLSSARASMIHYRVPALSMGLACSLLTLAVVATRRKDMISPNIAPASSQRISVVQRSVSSDNPFADPVAERLAEQSDTAKFDTEKD